MKNTEKKLFNEAQVKDYLLSPYLETLNKVCEYAVTEPGITRIAVLRFGEDCIDIAVWLTDASEENCDKHGAHIFNIDRSYAKIFPAEFYLSGTNLDRGLVVFKRENIKPE